MNDLRVFLRLMSINILEIFGGRMDIETIPVRFNPDNIEDGGYRLGDGVWALLTLFEHNNLDGEPVLEYDTETGEPLAVGLPSF